MTDLFINSRMISHCKPKDTGVQKNRFEQGQVPFVSHSLEKMHLTLGIVLPVSGILPLPQQREILYATISFLSWLPALALGPRGFTSSVYSFWTIAISSLRSWGCILLMFVTQHLAQGLAYCSSWLIVNWRMIYSSLYHPET